MNDPIFSNYETYYHDGELSREINSDFKPQKACNLNDEANI